MLGMFDVPKVESAASAYRRIGRDQPNPSAGE